MRPTDSETVAWGTRALKVQKKRNTYKKNQKNNDKLESN